MTGHWHYVNDSNCNTQWLECKHGAVLLSSKALLRAEPVCAVLHSSKPTLVCVPKEIAPAVAVLPPRPMSTVLLHDRDAVLLLLQKDAGHRDTLTAPSCPVPVHGSATMAAFCAFRHQVGHYTGSFRAGQSQLSSVITQGHYVHHAIRSKVCLPSLHGTLASVLRSRGKEAATMYPDAVVVPWSALRRLQEYLDPPTRAAVFELADRLKRDTNPIVLGALPSGYRGILDDGSAFRMWRVAKVTARLDECESERSPTTHTRRLLHAWRSVVRRPERIVVALMRTLTHNSQSILVVDDGLGGVTLPSAAKDRHESIASVTERALCSHVQTKKTEFVSLERATKTSLQMGNPDVACARVNVGEGTTLLQGSRWWPLRLHGDITLDASGRSALAKSILGLQRGPRAATDGGYLLQTNTKVAAAVGMFFEPPGAANAPLMAKRIMRLDEGAVATVSSEIATMASAGDAVLDVKLLERLVQASQERARSRGALKVTAFDVRDAAAELAGRRRVLEKPVESPAAEIPSHMAELNLSLASVREAVDAFKSGGGRAPKVLLVGERGGVSASAWHAAGADVATCDRYERKGGPTEVPHFRGDAKYIQDEGWDLVIAHPPCTYLSNAGVQYLHSEPGRPERMLEAAAEFRRQLAAKAPFVAAEQPKIHGYAKTAIGGLEPSQYVHPWQHGTGQTKPTALYLSDNLPPLTATRIVPGRARALANLSPSPERGELRSRTFIGIAAAMAIQWTPVLLRHLSDQADLDHTTADQLVLRAVNRRKTCDVACVTQSPPASEVSTLTTVPEEPPPDAGRPHEWRRPWLSKPPAEVTPILPTNSLRLRHRQWEALQPESGSPPTAYRWRRLEPSAQACIAKALESASSWEPEPESEPEPTKLPPCMAKPIAAVNVDPTRWREASDKLDECWRSQFHSFELAERKKSADADRSSDLTSDELPLPRHRGQGRATRHSHEQVRPGLAAFDEVHPAPRPTLDRDPTADEIRVAYGRQFVAATAAPVVVAPVHRTGPLASQDSSDTSATSVVAAVSRDEPLALRVGDSFTEHDVIASPPAMQFEAQCAYIKEFAVARHRPTRSGRDQHFLLGNATCQVSNSLGDTGAGPSILGSKLLAHLPADACVSRASSPATVDSGLSGAGNEPIVTSGEATLLFTLSGVPFRHTFTVVEGGNLLLLGNDFMAAYHGQVSLDPTGEGELSLMVKQQGESRRHAVELSCAARADVLLTAAVVKDDVWPSPRSRHGRTVASVVATGTSSRASTCTSDGSHQPSKRSHAKLQPETLTPNTHALCTPESCIVCGPLAAVAPQLPEAEACMPAVEESSHPALVPLGGEPQRIESPATPDEHVTLQKKTEDYLLYCEQPIRIAARTETTVWLRAPLALRDDQTAYPELMIDRLDTREGLSTGVHVACSLSVPDDRGRVPVRLINASHRAVTVGASMALARARVEYEAEVRGALDSTSEHAYERLSSADRSLIDDLEEVKGLDPDGRLTEEQKNRVRDVVARRIRAFAHNPKDPAHTHLMTVKLPLKPDVVPHRHAAARLGEAGNAIVDAHCAEMEANGIIRKSNSAWGSRIVLVKKKDGSVRFCIDFRDTNSKLVTLDSPIPRCDEAIDRLASGNGPQSSLFISTLDLASGFWTLPIEEEDKCITAFVTNRQKYEWNYLPFGIQSGPSYMCRLMDAALQGLAWDICVPYLDDVGIHSTGVGGTAEERELASFEQHLTRLDLVLERFIWAGLTAKITKCVLFATKTAYLGHVIGRDGLEMDPKKVDKIKAVTSESINTLERVRSFLGLCSYYRRFIPRFAHIATPLTDLTKDGVDVPVESQQPLAREAVDTLVAAMTSEPVVLRMPRWDREFIVKTDAAATGGVGGVLSQCNDEGHEQVVAYYGRRLTDAERKWTVTEIELLAALESIRNWRPYLWGRRFRLVVDHAALKWLHTMKDTIEGGPASRLMRWNMKLLEYDFSVEHKPGKDHSDADGVSRLVAALAVQANSRVAAATVTAGRLRAEEREQREASTTRRNITEAYLKVGTPTSAALLAAQEEDADCIAFRAYSENGQLGPFTDSESMRHFRWLRAEAQHLCTREDGVIVHIAPHGKRRRRRGEPVAEITPAAPRVYIPLSLRPAYLHAFHDALGHQGVNRTVAILRSRCYWPGLHADVHEHVRLCHECSVAKKARSNASACPTRPQMGAYAFDSVVCDLCHMGSTHDGKYDKVMVFADSLSRWVEVVPWKGDPTAEEVLDAFATHVACRYGWPRELRSDGGSNLANKLAEAVHAASGVDLIRGAPYHPQSQGIAERVQRTLATMCRAANEGGSYWADHLPYLMFSYHATPHRSTALSPAMLVYGHEMRLPAQLGDGVLLPAVDAPENDTPQAMLDYAQRLNALLRAAWTSAREVTKHEQEKEFREQFSAHNYVGDEYAAGDRVCHLLQGKIPKLNSQWSTPCRIKEVLGDGNYILTDTANRIMSDKFHVSQLRPYRTVVDAVELADDELLVDRLLGHRKGADLTQREYLVKWRGFPIKEATYEPRAELLRRCQSLVDSYDEANLPLPLAPQGVRVRRQRAEPAPVPRAEARAREAIDTPATRVSEDLPFKAEYSSNRWRYTRRVATPRGLRERVYDAGAFSALTLSSGHFVALREAHERGDRPPLESDELPYVAGFAKGRWQYTRRVATPRGLRDRVFDESVFTKTTLDSNHFVKLRATYNDTIPSTVAAVIVAERPEPQDQPLRWPTLPPQDQTLRWPTLTEALAGRRFSCVSAAVHANHALKLPQLPSRRFAPSVSQQLPLPDEQCTNELPWPVMDSRPLRWRDSRPTRERVDDHLEENDRLKRQIGMLTDRVHELSSAISPAPPLPMDLPMPTSPSNGLVRLRASKVAFYHHPTMRVYCWHRIRGGLDLPGGTRDATDDDDGETLLREVNEEVTIPPSLLEKLHHAVYHSPPQGSALCYRRLSEDTVTVWAVAAELEELASITQTDEGRSEGSHPALRSLEHFLSVSPYADALSTLQPPRRLRKWSVSRREPAGFSGPTTPTAE